ncbi:hypothetical protein OAT16_08990 [Prolixibacteraceae bacterium]|uniref:hypothetical protein n=1 Tax=Halosquirtibacter xylanolyticus TaxID=3374599 RepID=UPI0037494624|nr:hypothetical protein [Prolixibacteraceae bacterium]QZT36900.1 hypothetical protein K5X82_16940 [Prolixibacteraceae bacterium]
MKFLTKNLIYFATVIAITSIAFDFLFFNMNLGVGAGTYILPIAYGMICFCAGWFFGRRDRMELNLWDIGFRFNLTTFLVCNSIHEVWYRYVLDASGSLLRGLHNGMLIWSFFIIIHFYYFMRCRRGSIKGLKKDQIFD